MDEAQEFDGAGGSDPWWEPEDAYDDDLPDYDAPIPDDLDKVIETNNLESVFIAERYQRINALRIGALADGHRYGGAIAEVVERSVRLELAAALRLSESRVQAMMEMAEALVHRYPAVLEALGDARITESHAEAFVSMMDPLEDDVRERIVDRALDLVQSSTVTAFRRALRRLIETERDQTLAERHEQAVEARRVVVENVGDGMAWLHAYVPAVEARAIHGRITSMAKAIRKDPDETRSLDQVRADILGDLLVDGDTSHLPATARGIRATVFVTVPALSLLEDEHPAGADGAVVEGVGPIPHARARELCGGSKDWVRVLTHPETGMVLSVGRDRYEPPKMLRDLVAWRADRCMGPGCGMPASRCEVDHTLAWVDGGETSLANLAPLCKGHHTIKHHGGWRIRQVAASGGAIEWTSPSGRQYVVQPERRVPVFRPADASDAPF
ncbi:HNH endonuclease signature motif containing protein [Microbacterium thalassium]|uniref:HNH nuclease domain-containing protein n=1 Tax=Microbacterium thalassium TaxID=362649 RepID=A0A7X0FSE1_9MICO|nr:HNH endonuclease signature motif containing protein [Microbacterium thalassium]MBB6392684.1 hypothetical protein [Microbacterium thalassium]GLK23085.1 hypothetical protein GCM10017607_04030 [Microbacterium thalassium]